MCIKVSVECNINPVKYVYAEFSYQIYCGCANNIQRLTSSKAITWYVIGYLP